MVLRVENEQKMIAYQWCGEIYYQVYEDIEPGKELLVYYGEDYAVELGITGTGKVVGQKAVELSITDEVVGQKDCLTEHVCDNCGKK